MTKKREAGLNSYHLRSSGDESHGQNKVKIDMNLQENQTSQPIDKDPEKEKNIIVNQWLTERIKDKIQRASRLSLHTHKPIILYRKTIEEIEDSTEEEISYITGNYVIQFVYAYGGFVPSMFKTIDVYTIDRFTKWIIQENKRELLVQCIEELDQ